MFHAKKASPDAGSKKVKLPYVAVKQLLMRPRKAALHVQPNCQPSLPQLVCYITIICRYCCTGVSAIERLAPSPTIYTTTSSVHIG